MRVAIIGVGTAGVSVLRQLVKNEALKILRLMYMIMIRIWGRVYLFKMTAANY